MASIAVFIHDRFAQWRSFCMPQGTGVVKCRHKNVSRSTEYIYADKSVTHGLGNRFLSRKLNRFPLNDSDKF